jgi:Protein of unknown function (DUF4199)
MNMKKTVLTYGLLSGAIAIAMMAITMPFIEPDSMGTADVLGYTSILLSALLVFFGIRSYRENAGAGRMTFGRGFVVGLLITLISTTCYAAAFEIMYFKLVPDFGEKFSACMVERVRAAGGTPQEVEHVTSQARMIKQLYDNPATNAAMTFAMSFPIGLVVTLISAAILRRK